MGVTLVPRSSLVSMATTSRQWRAREGDSGRAETTFQPDLGLPDLGNEGDGADVDPSGAERLLPGTEMSLMIGEHYPMLWSGTRDAITARSY